MRRTHTRWTSAAAVFAMSVTLALAAGPKQAPGQGRVGPLSDQEKADLLHMREEEKLARDVYMAMYETWNVAVFSNIVRSEQIHMDAVATLLDRYGLADPVADLGVGEFATEEFQTLYADLVARGRASLVDALAVGCTIEEIDIIDLWEASAQATHKDIVRVYQNLEAASENHLRAFVGQLVVQGVTYEPQFLTPEQYEAIINP